MAFERKDLKIVGSLLITQPDLSSLKHRTQTALSSPQEQGPSSTTTQTQPPLTLTMSLLSLAILRGDMTAFQALVRDHQSINAQDSQGNTPLHYAVESGTQEMVALLLQNGASKYS